MNLVMQMAALNMLTAASKPPSKPPSYKPSSVVDDIEAQLTPPALTYSPSSSTSKGPVPPRTTYQPPSPPTSKPPKVKTPRKPLSTKTKARLDPLFGIISAILFFGSMITGIVLLALGSPALHDTITPWQLALGSVLVGVPLLGSLFACVMYGPDA